MNDVVQILLLLYGFLMIIFGFEWTLCYFGEFLQYIKSWMDNKNWFGKLYTVIAIIFCLPAIVLTMIFEVIAFIVGMIIMLGIKKENK